MTTPRAAALRARVRIAVATAPHTAMLAAGDSDDDRVKKLLAAGGAALALLAAKLAKGQITRAQFIAQATDAITPKVQQAAQAGAAVYGNADHLDSEDIATQIDKWGDKLDGFADTAAKGGFSQAQIASWALGLAGVIWTVHQRAKVDGAQGAHADAARSKALAAGATEAAADKAAQQAAATAPTWWELDAGVANHCDPDDDHPYDCPGLADQSPFDGEPPCYPGDGSTPCESHCYCNVHSKLPEGDD